MNSIELALLRVEWRIAEEDLHEAVNSIDPARLRERQAWDEYEKARIAYDKEKEVTHDRV